MKSKPYSAAGTGSPKHLPANARPVIDVHRFDSFLSAARERELKRAADIFACTGKNVFVHYVEPVLSKRRAALLLSGTTRKKFYKNATQLWAMLEEKQPDEYFYWNEMVARQVRNCLSTGALDHATCLQSEGRPEDAETSVWHAELAVGHYLGTEPPEMPGAVFTEPDSGQTLAVRGGATGNIDMLGTTERGLQEQTILVDVSALSRAAEKTVRPTMSITTAANNDTSVAAETDTSELFVTLPERFEVVPQITYGHFPRYGFNEARNAIGKAQTAMLRHLAERFDKSGKELFYYYMVPRLCKPHYPRLLDHTTVTNDAALIWSNMPGRDKTLWASASRTVKGSLGDGHLEALGMLQFDSLDSEVLRLHEKAQNAWDSYRARTCKDHTSEQA